MASGIGTYQGHLRVTSADGTTTSGTVTITSTSAAFTVDDVGRDVSGTNIPAGAKIAKRNSSSSADMDVAASGTGSSIAFTIQSPSTFGGSGPVRIFGANLRSSASNSANSYVKLRSQTSSGSVVLQLNFTASVEHNISLEPEGVLVNGPVYVDKGSTWAGHCYVYYG